jgi:hypothetical protein
MMRSFSFDLWSMRLLLSGCHRAARSDDPAMPVARRLLDAFAGA